MEDYIIGVDMGTTQTKAVLFDGAGQAVETIYQEYPMFQDETGKAEEDPDEIVRAVIFCIKNVIQKSQINPNQIAYITFGSAMHSLIVLEDGALKTNCMTWGDNRSATVCDYFKETAFSKELYEKTGTPTHPMSPFMKLLWLKEARPELLQSNCRYLGIKDYLFWKIFGVYLTDMGSASGTSFYNIHQRKWELSALDYLGIREEQLPEVVSPSYSLGKVPASWQEKLGVSQDTEFLIGGADGALANAGLGSVGKGFGTLTIGTSGAFRYITETPVIHPEGRSFCYAMDEKYYFVGGASNNGGVVFDWGRKNFLRQKQQEGMAQGLSSHEVVMKAIDEASLKQSPLLFYPYLLGERAPIWEANCQGAFVGLKTIHTESQMMRGIVEGICFNIKQIVEEVTNFSDEVVEMRATGGFTASKEWLQIMADILGKPIQVLDHRESSCFGSVLYGWQRLGKIQDISEGRQYVKVTHQVLPNMENVAYYQKVYDLYVKLAPTIIENGIQMEKLRKELQAEN